MRHKGDHFHDPCIVTSLRHRGTVVSQLREIQSGFEIICEPMGRNTCLLYTSDAADDSSVV